MTDALSPGNLGGGVGVFYATLLLFDTTTSIHELPARRKEILLSYHFCLFIFFLQVSLQAAKGSSRAHRDGKKLPANVAQIGTE